MTFSDLDKGKGGHIFYQINVYFNQFFETLIIKIYQILTHRILSTQ